MAQQAVGRFAPSPSGRLHLGNLFCFLLAWLSARQQGGRVILRIEDLDPARSKREYTEQLQRDLALLGLVWDEGGLDAAGPHAPYEQSRRPRSMSRPWRSCAHRSWSIPAFVPAHSYMPPARPMPPTARSSMREPAVT